MPIAQQLEKTSEGKQSYEQCGKFYTVGPNADFFVKGMVQHTICVPPPKKNKTKFQYFVLFCTALIT